MDKVIRLIKFLKRIRDQVEPVVQTYLQIDLDIQDGVIVAVFKYARSDAARIGFQYYLPKEYLSDDEFMISRADFVIRSLLEIKA